ncbi:MAG TPA: hypothetical protein VJJ82_04025 [Candidatus Nanoarchaeia archaeon]|nr:hypothetical protein [Candidatus Nanoarchaeia archaeon]
MSILEVKDKTGRAIHLSIERWKHISHEHPELVSYFQEFGSVLQNPLRIGDDEFDERVKYYYKHVKELARHILLIVRIKLRG